MGTDRANAIYCRYNTARCRIGQQYGRWTIVRWSHRAPGAGDHWVCRCECGTEKTVRAANIVRGQSRSCGCYSREVRSVGHPRHGKSRTRVYKKWASMISRCKSPANPSYRHYGGRGICVCDRWLSFENFWADMGEPGPGQSLDRIDVDGNYEPSNCRWASIRTQNNNKNTNRFLSCDGKTMTVAEWARHTGIRYGTLVERLRAEWPIDQALKTSVRKVRR